MHPKFIGIIGEGDASGLGRVVVVGPALAIAVTETLVVYGPRCCERRWSCSVGAAAAVRPPARPRLVCGSRGKCPPGCRSRTAAPVLAAGMCLWRAVGAWREAAWSFGTWCDHRVGGGGVDRPSKTMALASMCGRSVLRTDCESALITRSVAQHGKRARNASREVRAWRPRAH